VEAMKKIQNVFINIIDVIVFTMIMFIKVISLNYALKLMDENNVALMMGCLGSVFVISSILCLFDFKRRIKVFLGVDFLISLILMVDLVYNRYFYDVTSIALIKQARLVSEVKDSVGALIRFSDFIYFFDLLILIPLYKMLKNKYKIQSNFSIRIRAALLVVFLTLGYTLSYNSVLALNRNQPGILKTLYDKKWIVKGIGDLNFHMIDFYKYVTNRVLKKEKLTEEEKKSVEQWYNSKNAPQSKKYTGIMKGKNLIIVQLESFQGFLLNAKINGQEITPNLNKLAQNSLVFDNYHYQTAWGGTSDAEFLSNVSLLPAREGSVYYQYAGNTYDSIVKQLKDRGYFTAVMHSNRPGFWNRVEMYRAIGFDRYESEKDFNIDDIQGIGLSDKSFFRQSVEKMKAYSQPFYAFLITLSSHFPYKDPEDKIKNILNVGSFEGKLMGDYLKAVKYTDEAIGEFINELKDAGLWNNSVVVFYGDHSAIPQSKSDQLSKLLYNKDSLTPLEWAKLQKVVAMIHFPDESIKGHSKITASQMDLYPTLANLFGFKSKYAMGQDLLNAKNGFMVNRDGIWADNNVIYLKGIDKVLDLNTGKELDRRDYEEEFKKAYEYLKNSDAVLDYNLIKEFGK
jgi:lipoteichoic acid synthase